MAKEAPRQNGGNLDGDKMLRNSASEAASILYLSRADNPEIVLTPIVHTKDNNDEWNEAMNNVLQAKRKIGFTNSGFVKAEDMSTEIARWSRDGAASFGRGHRNGNGIKANVAQHRSTTGSKMIGRVHDVGRKGLEGLTDTQWTTLLKMLSNQNQTAGWIIDTGASNHMTGKLKWLHDTQDVSFFPVGLPNAEQAMAVKEGNLVLHGNLALDHVLYVQKLNCNLISVSQLLKETNYFVEFTDKLCVIKDCTTRTLIGVGEQREGLYYFSRAVTHSVHHIVKGTHELWHQSTQASVI